MPYYRPRFNPQTRALRQVWVKGLACRWRRLLPVWDEGCKRLQ